MLKEQTFKTAPASASVTPRLRARVLIMTDEPDTGRVWAFSLEQVGLEVNLVSVFEDPMSTWAEQLPDLVVLEDFNKQDEEMELCQQLRADTAVPVLYLTGHNDEVFILEAYRAGADEVVSFPISPRLFQAKVLAWLRRTQPPPAGSLDDIHLSNFSLSPSQKRLRLPWGDVVRLTSLEARLLFLLMGHPGVPFETAQLVERVWGGYGCGDSSLLKNLVYRLRRKIEPDPTQPCYLLTEGTQGYKFSRET